MIFTIESFMLNLFIEEIIVLFGFSSSSEMFILIVTNFLALVGINSKLVTLFPILLLGFISIAQKPFISFSSPKSTLSRLPLYTI